MKLVRTVGIAATLASLSFMSSTLAFADDASTYGATVNVAASTTIPKPPAPPHYPPQISNSNASTSPDGKRGASPGLMGSASTTANLRAIAEMKLHASTTEGTKSLAALLITREMKMRDKLLAASSTASTTRPSASIRAAWKDQWQKTASSTRKHIQIEIMGETKNVTDRLTGVINSLDSIASRIESRIQKMSDNGDDVTNATNDLADARGALDAANTDLESAISLLDSVFGSSNPRDAFTEVQDAVNKVKDDLKAAYASLQKSVADIKAAVPNKKTTTVSASTTEEN
jgi:hypothetical protein